MTSYPKLEKGESGFRDLLRKYKRGAAERGYPFDLTEAQFRSLTKLDCHYCGQKPANKSYGFARTDIGKERTAYINNGIDRKDPTLGYVLDNCVPACSDCNFAKQSLTYDEFLALVRRINACHPAA